MQHLMLHQYWQSWGTSAFIAVAAAESLSYLEVFARS